MSKAPPPPRQLSAMLMQELNSARTPRPDNWKLPADCPGPCPQG